MARRRLRGIGITLLLIGIGWLGLARWLAPVDAQNAHVAVLGIDGPIDAISARYLARGLDEASDGGAALVVVELDTPGGRLDSTRDMVEAILESRAPVAVYVSPSGARAASAGTFITAAANVAVMAPATNIGAASPVGSSGEDLPETLARKVNEDTRAFIRALAERRGRNAGALEETVTLARAYSASEALALGIVDLIAEDLDDLLARVDGRTVETAAGTVTLRTAGAPVRRLGMTLLERFLAAIADPNIAFLLLSLGGLALMAEFFSPGAFGPGIAGVIMLVLAFVALGQLPVNWVGAGLILFAMALFYFELQAPGVGVFGAGGLAAFLTGAFLLFGGFFQTPDVPEPSVGVSRWLIGVMAAALLAALFGLYALLRQGGASDARVSASGGGLEGERGVALSAFDASGGMVRVGEREWPATVEEGERIDEGQAVRVVAVYSGGVLKVSGRLPEAEPRARRSLAAALRALLRR